jgi:hypothetical protein
LAEHPIGNIFRDELHSASHGMEALEIGNDADRHHQDGMASSQHRGWNMLGDEDEGMLWHQLIAVLGEEDLVRILVAFKYQIPKLAKRVWREMSAGCSLWARFGNVANRGIVSAV